MRGMPRALVNMADSVVSGEVELKKEGIHQAGIEDQWIPRLDAR